MTGFAESFAWPLRGRWRPPWAMGLLCLLLLPILFIPLFGYGIEAVHAAAMDPSKGPPPWRWSAGLLLRGGWAAFALAISALPFAIVYNLVVDALINGGATILVAQVIAFFALALPWGLLALVVAPHTTATFAMTGSPTDLFDVGGAVRGVRARFATWNLAAAAIVTAWAIGLAGAGLLCVGVVPGVFYAILVSAHAAASLYREGHDSPAR